MITVQRGNVVLQVAEDSVTKYMNLGYNVIDDKGNVIEECIPNDLGTLQKHFIESKKRIAELEEQLAQLQKKKDTKRKEVVSE